MKNQKADIILKRKAETSDRYGTFPEKREIKELINYGIVNIDKPPGPTSHQVSGYVKDILQLKKCGHSGSLDPKVTGVLPVGLEHGTKIVQALLKSGKEYICLMHLHQEVSEEKLRLVCSSFIGTITQLPPVRSAVKRQYRERDVYYLNILEFDGKDVLFVVGCEAGTYIRKLVHDVGQKLGVGAHMAELRRTRVADFTENSAVTLQDLSDALAYYKEGNDKFLKHCLHNVEEGVSHLPKIWVMDSAIHSLCNGASLHVPGISKFNNNISAGGIVAVMSLKNELVCLGIATINSSDIKKKESGVAVKTDRVFMIRDTYPKSMADER